MSTNEQTNLIVKYISGSKLYGTDTPQSDTDVSGIFVETLDNIILQRDAKHHTETTASHKNKNAADDTDISLKELRTFIKDAMNGQSYAIEALFIPRIHILQTSETYKFLVQNRDKLIGNLKPILGYCRAQAQKFTMKGARLDTLDETLAVLNDYPLLANSPVRMEAIRDLLPHTKYSSIVPHDNGKGVMVDHFQINGLLFSLNLNVKYVREALEKKRREYGHRAEDSRTNGYDGKAYSHAIRLADEFIQLALNGEIVFPLPNAEWLRMVKLCEEPQEIVQEVLDDRLMFVEELKTDSIGKPDRKFWDEWILSEYKK